MTSKISGNKKISLWSLMREDLRHRAWMIALSLLGSFLASPVAFLFLNDRNISYYSMYAAPSLSYVQRSPLETAWYLASEMTSYLIGAHLVLQMIVLFAGAVIVAVFGFRHLYSRRMTDLYHSAPVTRGRLFLAQWLDGFLIWLVPFLAGNLCVWIMMLFRIGMPACWGPVNACMWRLILLCALCFLIIYNACLVAVMISGNIMNALLNLLTYGLVVLVGNVTIVSYMNTCFSTFHDRSSLYLNTFVMALSPLASPVLLAYASADGSLLSERFGLLLLSALLMVVNFALAMILHGKRASELAERGLEAKFFRIPMRFILSCLSGLLLALFFRSLAHGIGWCIFGAVFGSVLAFTVLNIIYHGGFKFLFLHKIQLALAVLVTCGIGWIFAFDIFGYDTYLPKTSDIRGMSLFSACFMGDSYKLEKKRENGYFYWNYRNEPNENLRFTDPEAIHSLLEALSRPAENYSGRSVQVIVRVETSHGAYYREYRLRNTPEHREAIRPFLESDSYRECYYPDSAADWELPKAIQIRQLANNTPLRIDDPERIRQLHEAYRKDFLENYSLEASYPGSYLNRMICYFPTDSGKTGATMDDFNIDGGASLKNSVTCTLYFSDAYRNVCGLLREWYPDACWSVEDLTLEALDIRIYSAGKDLPALYEYFGLTGTSGELPDTPALEPAAAPINEWEQYYASEQHYEWEQYITDPELLAAWQPHLILGDRKETFFNAKEFILTGVATFTWGQSDSNKYTAECFVEKGTLPEKLLEELIKSQLPEDLR